MMIMRPGDSYFFSLAKSLKGRLIIPLRLVDFGFGFVGWRSGFGNGSNIPDELFFHTSSACLSPT